MMKRTNTNNSPRNQKRIWYFPVEDLFVGDGSGLKFLNPKKEKPCQNRR